MTFTAEDIALVRSAIETECLSALCVLAELMVREIESLQHRINELVPLLDGQQ